MILFLILLYISFKDFKPLSFALLKVNQVWKDVLIFVKISQIILDPSFSRIARTDITLNVNYS